MPKQFIFPFADSPAPNAGNFIVGPCNQQALDFLERWPDWPAPAVALFGPAGCGKSHLASIWRNRTGASVIFAGNVAASGAQLRSPSRAFVIEDLDCVPPDASRDRILMALFDAPGKSLLLTGRSPPVQWPAVTGDWNSRLRSLLALEIRSPDDEFLAALMERNFAERQLQVPGSVVARILTHLERTPAAVIRFIEGADQKALSEKRPVSLRLVMELLGDSEKFETSAGFATAVSAGLAP